MKSFKSYFYLKESNDGKRTFFDKVEEEVLKYLPDAKFHTGRGTYETCCNVKSDKIPKGGPWAEYPLHFNNDWEEKPEPHQIGYKAFLADKSRREWKAKTIQELVKKVMEDLL